MISLSYHSPASPVLFLPFKKGRFDFNPGLYSFPYDFGNGLADQAILLSDQQKEKYITHKKNIYSSEKIRPYYFQKHKDYSAKIDTQFNDFFQQFSPNTYSSIDELYLSCQEDIILMAYNFQTQESYPLWIGLCCPQGWSAEKAITKNFTQLHSPVPLHTSGWISRWGQIIAGLFKQGAKIRFAWGINQTNEIDQHPRLGNQRFSPNQNQHGEEYYLRVERQILYPLSMQGHKTELGLYYFGIRVYFYALSEIFKDDKNKQLICSQIASMDQATLNYKSLTPEVIQRINLL